MSTSFITRHHIQATYLFWCISICPLLESKLCVCERMNIQQLITHHIRCMHAGVSHSQLFTKPTNHICTQGNLSGFITQDIL
jgi:hypothetical protein